MQIRSSLFGALVVFFLGLGLPISAVASTDASDWTVSNTLVPSANDNKTVVVNVSRCKELFGTNFGEADFVFALKNNSSKPSNEAEYSIKFRQGNQRCDTDKLEPVVGDQCETIVNSENLNERLDNASRIVFPRSVAELTTATSADTCEDLSEFSYIYFIVRDFNAAGSENIYPVTYTINFQTVRPKSVSDVTATGGSEAIRVSWSAVPPTVPPAAKVEGYKVYYGAEGVNMALDIAPEVLARDRDIRSFSTSSTSARLTAGISPNMIFRISVCSVDEFGNESLLGEIIAVETVPANDFWDTFRSENADVDGGFCFIATAAWGSTQEPHVALLRRFRDEILMPTAFGRAFVETYYSVSPPLAHFIGQYPAARAVARTMLWPVYGFAYLSLHAPVVLGILGALLIFGVGFVVRRRLRIRHISRGVARTAGVVLALALASTFAANEAFAEASPVNMMIEFKAGPYTPDKLGTAFDTHFGDSSGYLIELEYDWQFWRGVGSLGLGFHLGYGSISGKSVDKAGNRTIDSTSLHWLPLRLSLVYRFDYLWTRFNFPFTLYAKAGFDYVFWWVIDGSGSVSTAADGTKGYGGTFGFHAVGGVAFVLNWLAPGMAKSFDVEWGVNNSYIFAEFMYAQIDNFGARGAFNLTDQATFLIGLGLEF